MNEGFVFPETLTKFNMNKLNISVEDYPVNPFICNKDPMNRIVRLIAEPSEGAIFNIQFPLDALSYNLLKASNG